MNRISCAGVLSVSLLFAPQQTLASSRGVVGTDCGGCHGDEGDSTIELSPNEFELGSKTTLRFTIRDADARVAGMSVELEDPSQFTPTAGSGLANVFNGITHTSPQAISDGSAEFEIEWEVPSSAGATRITVGWVAANANGTNNGDEGHQRQFDLIFGCESQTFYRDYDGDGFGSSMHAREFCQGAAPDGYAEREGDCNEGNSERYPGAIELCNGRDDDCDGDVDEEAVPVELYPDEDGDGYFSGDEKASGMVLLGCVPTTGYAAEGGDCDADNPAANPGATEICDLFTDEDCNGRVDDRVRPLCGVGGCTRASVTCNEADCTPGLPQEETCNFIDDDCDGVVDEGDLCADGMACAAGECRNLEPLSAELSGEPAHDREEVPADSQGPPPTADSTSRGGSSAHSGCAYLLTPRGTRTPWLLLLIVCFASSHVRRRRHHERKSPTSPLATARWTSSSAHDEKLT